MYIHSLSKTNNIASSQPFTTASTNLHERGLAAEHSLAHGSSRYTAGHPSYCHPRHSSTTHMETISSISGRRSITPTPHAAHSSNNHHSKSLSQLTLQPSSHAHQTIPIQKKHIFEPIDSNQFKSDFEHNDKELLAYIRHCLAQSLAQTRGKSKPDMRAGKTDENFHNYTFVKNIRKRVDHFVACMLNEHLKSQKASSPVENLVLSLMDKIITSQEYARLVHQITQDAKLSVEHLLDHVGSKGYLEDASSKVFHSQDSSFSAHSAATYESSSIGSITSGVCPGADELKHMFGHLHPGQPFECRVSAVQRLASFSIGDMLSDEFWPDAKRNLELSLGDPDTRITLVVLRIVARAFKTAPTYMIPEVYQCLVWHLVQTFENASLDKISLGLDIRDHRIEVTLKKFRLLNQFMMEIPSLWFRFPEHVFKNVMNVTFRLLCSPRKWDACITPMHYLSIIDPHSTWFEKWTLSNLGRTHVIGAMSPCGCISDFSNAFINHIVNVSVSEKQMATSHDDEILVEDVDQNDDGDVRYLITKSDLEYVYFLHVTVMLSRLSLSTAGRLHFPIKIEESAMLRASPIAQFLLVPDVDPNTFTEKYELSLRSFILILIRQMSSNAKLLNAGNSTAENNSIDVFNMSKFMSRILKSMALADSQYREELCKDDFLKELVKPIELTVKGQTTSFDEASLLAIAETLSDIAATDTGRRFILRGQVNLHCPHYNAMSAFSGNSINPTLDTIATFVKHTLTHSTHNVGASRQVLGSYIFFLRQFYRSCEGLLWLQKYSLHTVLEPIRDSGGMSKEDAEWNMVLMDNLLNFAATPKGVLLLQQTGSMEPCVAYMFQRYQKKLKVSKSEKFGYGTLVSQVSTTSAGMEALCKAGLVGSFIRDVWSLLSGNRPFGAPNLEIDDHSAIKTVSNVLKVFTSFTALSTCLCIESDNSVVPNTFTYLIRKLVLLDTDVDNDWLVSYEDSHQIGLRILRLVTSSLDSLILLESTFKYIDFFWKLQDDSFICTVDGKDASTFVIDENSLLRNYILSMSLSVGGAGERHPPPTMIPIVTTLLNTSNIVVMRDRVIPESILPTLDKQAYTNISGSENAKLCRVFSDADKLTDSTNADLWINDLQNIITLCISHNLTHSIPFSLCSQLFTVLASVLPKCSDEILSTMGWNAVQSCTRHPSASQSADNEPEFYPTCKLGVKMVANYASRLLSQDSKILAKSIEEFYRSIKRNHYIFEPPKRKFTGFDWFIATLYIMTHGDGEAVQAFLDFFSFRMLSLFMWSRPLEFFSKDTLGLKSTMELLRLTSCHLVEYILSDELPMISSAFMLSGCTPTQMCQRWFRECFWTILPFSEITNYITISLVFGIDYHIYFAIALIRHVREQILVATRDHTLIEFMNDGQQIGKGFMVCECMEYMHALRDRHRGLVLAELKLACGADRL
ncbi:hypothetical protein QVD99_002342 [Batrachochytrium dendrobatidis]|nr:hypothetical protein O5D80_004968 [Batrachochytrium dendrobatidis]KAK5671322.1 hypothetical protein QVD99_002342 [Batrachochytrium dendrobatidis]